MANVLHGTSPPPLSYGEATVQRLLDSRERHKGLGDWFHKIARPRTINKALGELTGSNGGYLVPQELLLGVDAYLLERSLFQQHAFVIPMTTEECLVGTVDLTAANASGESPLFGGMTMAFQQEGVQVTESEPVFAQPRLVSRNLQSYVVVSNQMVNDGGPALGAYLESIFARLILWTVERNCFLGNGIGQPLGVVNAPGTALVARTVAGEVSQQDLTTMMSGLLPASYVNAVWACSVTAMASIANMADFVVNAGPSQKNLAGHIFGRPIYVTENLPPLGTQGDVLLFDPSLYLLGQREIEVAASDQVLFQTYQTAFRLIWRGDGLPLVNNTVQLADGSTDVAAYVSLGDAT